VSGGGRRKGSGRPRSSKALLPNVRAASAAAALMRPRVFEARLAGMSFSRIGRALGIATSTAFEHYTEYIRQHEHPPEEIDRVRALEIERLEWQREKLVQVMEGADAMVRARLSDAMTRVSERLARLRPIEVAQQVHVDADVTVQDSSLELDEAQLRTLAEHFAKKYLGAGAIDVTPPDRPVLLVKPPAGDQEPEPS
jgi:hypothetical protein